MATRFKVYTLLLTNIVFLSACSGLVSSIPDPNQKSQVSPNATPGPYGYVSGITTIDFSHSVNSDVLVDGLYGYLQTQWTSHDVFDYANYPMRAVFNLNQIHEIQSVEFLQGNSTGTGALTLKYLPVGLDPAVAGNYQGISVSGATNWNSWNPFPLSQFFTAQYFMVEIDYPHYTEISEVRFYGHLP